MATVEPGRRERKKLATRRHIAMTAIRLFLERGFDDVSVAEIAEAADVSKVTVFNHFPAKTDMVFELVDERGSAPVGAVRGRAPGVSALEAVRDYYLRSLAQRAEWTGLHDGIEPFVRMAWGSPVLLAAFAKRSYDTEQELANEIAVEVGEQPSAISPFRNPDAYASAPGSLSHQVVATLISAVMVQLTNANLARMLAGQTADEAEPVALTDARNAFGLLAGGIGDYARRAS